MVLQTLYTNILSVLIQYVKSPTVIMDLSDFPYNSQDRYKIIIILSSWQVNIIKYSIFLSIHTLILLFLIVIFAWYVFYPFFYFIFLSHFILGLSLILKIQSKSLGHLVGKYPFIFIRITAFLKFQTIHFVFYLN